jgi:hypothetical protein
MIVLLRITSTSTAAAAAAVQVDGTYCGSSKH